MIPALAHIGDASHSRRRRSRSLARRTADAIAHAVAEVLENDRVASRAGLLQRIDPRVKLVTIVGFAVMASFVHSIAVLAGLALATIALAAASGLSAGSFARKVWGSAGLLSALVAAPALTGWISPGHAILAIGPMTLTQTGLTVAVRLVLRVVAGAGIGLLVVWTTRWTDLLAALTAMRVPDVVVATLAMTQQQIVSLLRSVENMHLARESRMLTTGSARENRGWVVERMAYVATRSIKTADDVYDAMLSRGFTGAMPSLRRFRVQIRDWIWIATSVAACALALGIDRMVMPR